MRMKYNWLSRDKYDRLNQKIAKDKCFRKINKENNPFQKQKISVDNEISYLVIEYKNKNVWTVPTEGSWCCVNEKELLFKVGANTILLPKLRNIWLKKSFRECP